MGGLIDCPRLCSSVYPEVNLVCFRLSNYCIMSERNLEEEQPAAPKCTPNYDTSDPLQQEVTRILRGFKNDILGITFLGNDGVLRSLTADRKVLSAEGLSKPLLYENGHC
jgi:hypothetical protein